MSSRQQTRERVAQMRAEQARKEKRTERLIRLGVAGLVVGALVAVGIAFQASRGSIDAGSTLPEGITAPAGGVVVGRAAASVKMDIWLDFQCPSCKSFEESDGEVVASGIEDGSIQVTYHPMSFLGPESKVAANAFGCAVDAGKPQEYLTTLYVNQGAENSGVFTNAALVGWGKDLGFGNGFASCVEKDTYAGWVGNVARQAQDDGITSTPTIKVNGTQLEQTQLAPEEFAKVIEAAKG